MATSFANLRRDIRHTIDPGCGEIELAAPQDMRSVSGALTCLSVSGLGFKIVTGDLEFESGAVLGACTLHVGRRTIRGEFTVRNRRPIADGTIEYGGLFYPASSLDEAQLHACIASLERHEPQEPAAAGLQSGVDPAASLRGLYLRCANCHRANWFGSRSKCVICQCGATLGLGDFAGADSRDQLGDLARQLAQLGEIDLPAGYAIVAGSMTLEQAVELGHASSPACSHAALPQSERRQAARYDPAFEDAVSAGLLSPIQAFERGRRESFALTIVERHNLDIEQAYAVADNRLSLLAAIRASRPGVVTIPQAAPASNRPRRAQYTVLGVFVLGLVAVFAWNGFRQPSPAQLDTMPDVIPLDRPGREHADRSATLRAATTVERNASGQPIQVVGPDPRSVLLASCESLADSSNLEAVEVTSAFPPSADARLGVVRRITPPELYVLHIRKDPSTRRWYAGDGTRPLAPEMPSAAIREHVTR